MSAPTMPLAFFISFLNGCVLFICRVWPFKILLYFHCYPPTPRLPTVLEPAGGRGGRGSLLRELSGHCLLPPTLCALGVRLSPSSNLPAPPAPGPWPRCPFRTQFVLLSFSQPGHHLLHLLCLPQQRRPSPAGRAAQGRGRGLKGQTVGVQIPAGPLGSCVTLGGLLHLSASWNGNSSRCCVRACLWRGCRDW